MAPLTRMQMTELSVAGCQTSGAAAGSDPASIRRITWSENSVVITASVNRGLGAAAIARLVAVALALALAGAGKPTARGPRQRGSFEQVVTIEKITLDPEGGAIPSSVAYTEFSFDLGVDGRHLRTRRRERGQRHHQRPWPDHN